MKIRPVGVEKFDVDGQTDMNVTVTFRNFAIAPKMNHSRITETVLFSLTIADHKDVIG